MNDQPEPINITADWEEAAAADRNADDGEEWQYPNVETFVREYFSRVINRHLSDRPGSGLTWDPTWWRHREVYERLTALWQAYEGAVLAQADDPSALSRWWIVDVDGHLKVLLDGHSGPMSHTDPDGTWPGHGPLRCEPVPQGYDPTAP